MKCSNKDCKEESPLFYKGGGRKCKACKRAYQLKYRSTPEGELSHKKSDRKYWSSEKGREKARIRMREWMKWNAVTRDTLNQGIPFASCDDCPEVFSGRTAHECPVANGAENLSVCEVWRDWKHTKQHPLRKEEESIIFMESPYREDEDIEEWME